jgi:Protein of unknown function (DUF2934)
MWSQMKRNTDASQNNRNYPDEVLRQKIEERAYHIWLASGRRHGDHERHWLQAERELVEATKRGTKPQADARSRKKTAKPH